MDVNDSIFIFQVYLPTTKYIIDVYRSCIDELEDLHAWYAPIGRVFVIGVFNGHFEGTKYGGPFRDIDRFLSKLCQETSRMCLTTSDVRSGSNSSCLPYGDAQLADYYKLYLSSEP